MGLIDMTGSPSPVKGGSKVIDSSITRKELTSRADGVSADPLLKALALGAGLAVLAILGLILVTILLQAMPALRKESFDFVTSSRWAPDAEVFGALAFMYGTVVSSAVAILFAVPVSIGIALFISEVAPARLKASATFLMDMLASVPSVVFGLWGILVLAPWIVKLYERVSDATARVPILGGLFEGPVNGKSYMTAGLILALMITPIITSISREVFDTVPADQKAGAWALGTTRWEMIRGVILPSSRAGVVAAVMLGLGRALGETIAAALVIGSAPQITSRLFAPGDSMAAVIANQFGEAGGLHRSALIGLGVLLFAITIVVNVGGRLIVRRTATGNR